MKYASIHCSHAGVSSDAREVRSGAFRRTVKGVDKNRDAIGEKTFRLVHRAMCKLQAVLLMSFWLRRIGAKHSWWKEKLAEKVLFEN
jgi:hypothetical protein